MREYLIVRIMAVVPLDVHRMAGQTQKTQQVVYTKAHWTRFFTNLNILSFEH